MNIVITGSLGNIGKPLTQRLIRNGHTTTVITSKATRKAEIEALGATAAVGTMQDADFLTETFRGADVIYLMEAWEGVGSVFDNTVDFTAAFKDIAHNYKRAVEQAGIKRIVHLSSIGAHTDNGTGSLAVHQAVETILNELAGDVAIKFIRPVGFYTNLFRHLQTIKGQGAIIQSYGGDRKEPWVSPLDIAESIVEEIESPSTGRSVRYVASDEVSPNEVAAILGDAIGNTRLEWKVIPPQQQLEGMLANGMNEWIARGFVNMQIAQGDGSLYEDFYLNKPVMGEVKFKEFAKEFAEAYNQQ